MNKNHCKKNYFAVEEYFLESNKNKFSPSVMHNQELNIGVKIYFRNLCIEQLKKVHLEIEQTILQFKKFFDLSPCISSSPTIFNVFIFDNKNDYDGLADSIEVTCKINGGMAHYVGRDNSHSNVYVYYHNGIANLKHEMAHALTFYVTKGYYSSLPPILIDGIAEYFEHHRRILYLEEDDYECIMSGNMMNIEYSKFPGENSSIYRSGYAVVSYLQNEKPGLLNKIFTSLRERNAEKFRKLCEEILDARTDIKNWAYQNSLEVAAASINLLFIKNKPFSLIKKRPPSPATNHEKYSTAYITDHSGKIVGRFSHIVHLWIKEKLCSINSIDNSLVTISSNYYFIKMVNNNELAYCNKHGELYKDSAIYKHQISSLIYNKIPDIAAKKIL